MAEDLATLLEEGNRLAAAGQLDPALACYRAALFQAHPASIGETG
jgi:hypothetical protein